MKTNEIKKGMVVELRDGWYGVMADNMKGNTRIVDGMFRKTDGTTMPLRSVYSHDIVRVWPNTEITLESAQQHLYHSEAIEHTKSQINLRRQTLAIN
jgi:predicted membrane GTPase involved in stress response